MDKLNFLSLSLSLIISAGSSYCTLECHCTDFTLRYQDTLPTGCTDAAFTFLLPADYERKPYAVFVSKQPDPALFWEEPQRLSTCLRSSCQPNPYGLWSGRKAEADDRLAYTAKKLTQIQPGGTPEQTLQAKSGIPKELMRSHRDISPKTTKNRKFCASNKRNVHVSCDLLWTRPPAQPQLVIASTAVQLPRI